VLNVGVSVMDVADASREAVERFLALAPTRADLVGWLRGVYRRATAFVPQSLRSLSMQEQGLGDEEVADVVHHAQCAARQAIAAAVCPGAEGIARSLPEVLHLAEVGDLYGGSGFAAVDSAGACLADRVLALIVAEYLTRPDEFIDSAVLMKPLRAASSGVFPVLDISDEARRENTRPSPNRRG
jgi:hypothetical protein